MMESLLLKLGMLFVAMGISFWMLWSAQPQGQHVVTPGERATSTVPAPSFPPEQSPKAEAIASTMSATEPSHRLLDLNRASAGDLESLPGIGAVLAQRVLAFRDAAGGFRAIDDLRDVKGIGSKKFDRIKSLITVSPLKSHGAKQREL